MLKSSFLSTKLAFITFIALSVPIVTIVIIIILNNNSIMFMYIIFLGALKNNKLVKIYHYLYYFLF